MQKRLIVLLCFVLVFSISFASASWFGNFWGKITGNVVETDTNKTIYPNWCNGADINKNGVVDVGDLSLLGTYWNQNCSSEACNEADINKNGVVDVGDNAILGTFWNQKCSAPTVVCNTTYTCYDSDGLNYSLQGKVSIVKYNYCSDGNFSSTNESLSMDSCSGNTLVESYCNNSFSQGVSLLNSPCPFGCDNGICLAESKIVVLNQSNTNYSEINPVNQKQIPQEEVQEIYPNYSVDSLGDSLVCSETDAGEDPFNFGITTFNSVGYSDRCDGETHLIEYYCRNSEIFNSTIECSCNGGVCIQETEAGIFGRIASWFSNLF